MTHATAATPLDASDTGSRALRRAQFGFGSALFFVGLAQYLARAAFCAISPGVWGLYRALPFYLVLALASPLAGWLVCARARRGRLLSSLALAILRLGIAGAGALLLGVSVLRFHPRFVFMDAGFAACLAVACLPARLGLARRLALAAGLTASLAFALTETTLGAMAALRPPLPDYGDMLRPDIGPGGHLRPNVHGKIAGASGQPVDWITNADGFRAEQDFARAPHPGTYRILYVGDSFFGGFRVGQREHSGYLLEQELNHRLAALAPPVTTSGAAAPRRAEVLVACLEDPVQALHWLAKDGLAYRPDAIVYGFCLANDVTQSYFADFQRIGPYYSFVLPEDSQRPSGWPARAWDWFYSRFFEATKTGWALLQWRDRSSPVAIARGAKHEHGVAYAFDQVNGLGLFYKPSMPPIDQAIAETVLTFDRMNRLAQQAGSRLVVAFIPQRFQVSRLDWDAVLAAYRLRPDKFDLDLPNRRLGGLLDRSGVAHWDLRGAFAGMPSDERDFCPMGDMHWNALGHARVAKWMAGQTWTTFLASEDGAKYRFGTVK